MGSTAPICPNLLPQESLTVGELVRRDTWSNAEISSVIMEEEEEMAARSVLGAAGYAPPPTPVPEGEETHRSLPIRLPEDAATSLWTKPGSSFSRLPISQSASSATASLSTLRRMCVSVSSRLSNRKDPAPAGMEAAAAAAAAGEG